MKRRQAGSEGVSLGTGNLDGVDGMTEDPAICIGPLFAIGFCVAGVLSCALSEVRCLLYERSGERGGSE